jgi:multidrug efflux pump subunit AcrA (membrane-fusion protein)
VEPTPVPPPAPAPTGPTPVVEPETFTVAPGPFAVVLELPAAFEPVDPVEIAWRPQALGGDVEVLEAAPPGPVEAGQVLVRLKAARQEDQVGLQRLDMEIATANLERLQVEDKRREQALALQAAATKREAARAAADLTRFLEVERALRLAEAEHGLQGQENGLQDSLEELAQLEKMYKADDLTEETEEIVLKRSQRELERTKKRLAFSKQRQSWFLDITLPRDQENLEHRALETRLEQERVDGTSGSVLTKARAEFRKAQQEAELQKQALARAEADLVALVLRAPKAGRIVPGTCVKGRWQGVDETARLLRPGQKVRAEQVLFTLFEPGDLRVRTALPEANLFQVREGATGTVSPAAAEDLSLPVTVRTLAVAGHEGKHDVVLSLDAGDPRLLPGLSGKLRLRTRERTDALTVPETAVTREGEKTTVHVWANGAAAPRCVKLGATTDGRTEVLEGLVAGERVLVKRPCDKS